MLPWQPVNNCNKMKRSTLTILSEYNNAVTGYVTLYTYRLANLCIKADPVSLLGVTINTDGLVRNIDDVAVVASGDNEYEMKVVPMDESNLMLIGKGIAEEHIEFKQELDTLVLDGDIECKYIKLSMPEVNEERKKAMHNAVKLLHDECVAKVKASTAFNLGRMAAEMLGASKEDMDEVNSKMNEVTDMYNKICEDVTATKNKEIDEAYALYLKKRQDEQAMKAEQSATVGKEVVSQLKIK